jgi:hypothetical protein
MGAMPLVRFLVPVGLIVFGAVAGFMGAVVLIGGLKAGEIGWTSGPVGAVEVKRVRQVDDPDGFWRIMGLAGALPLALGLGAVFAGRRMLRDQ